MPICASACRLRKRVSPPCAVIGVMPPGFAHPGNAYRALADADTVDIWTPFPYRGSDTERGSHFMEGFARMKSGISVAQAQADLDGVVAQLGREHPNAKALGHSVSGDAQRPAARLRRNCFGNRRRIVAGPSPGKPAL